MNKQMTEQGQVVKQLPEQNQSNSQIWKVKDLEQAIKKIHKIGKRQKKNIYCNIDIFNTTKKEE